VNESRSGEAAEQPSVCAALVNWNAWEDTVACLAWLHRIDYPALDIVVVDNGSTDGSVERIRARYPDLALIEAGSNLGYGEGNNLGIAWARQRSADLVWIVNGDTEAPPDCLRLLVDAMSRVPRLGIVGPAARDPRTGAPEPRTAFPPGVSRPAAGSPSGRIPSGLELLDYVSGANMLIRRGVQDEIGGFDPRYFHFWEDADLCWRAWGAGWLVGRVDRCEIAHRVGSSTAGRRAMIEFYSLRNRLLFTARASGLTVWRACLQPWVLALVLRSLLGLRGFLEPSVKLARFRAVSDALAGRLGRNYRYSPAQRGEQRSTDCCTEM
jgi:GT2 family glycosyltransferase